MKRSSIDQTHEMDLYEAILELRDTDEARNFFNDLCTPAELEGLVDRCFRWQLVR